MPIDAGLAGAGRSLYGLARPRRVLPEASVVVHGIRTVDLEQAPPLDEAIVPLLEAMAGRVLVAHPAKVERAFLGGALRRQGLRLRGPVLDTNALGRLLMAERGGSPPRFLPLGQLAGDLRLPVHRQHNALSDALTTAQVFLAVVSHLEERGPETVGSLAMAQRRIEHALQFRPGTRGDLREDDSAQEEGPRLGCAASRVDRLDWRRWTSDDDVD